MFVMLKHSCSTRHSQNHRILLMTISVSILHTEHNLPQKSEYVGAAQERKFFKQCTSMISITYCFAYFTLQVQLRLPRWVTAKAHDSIVTFAFDSPAGFTMSCASWWLMPGHFRLWPPSWSDWHTWPQSLVGFDLMPDKMNLDSQAAILWISKEWSYYHVCTRWAAQKKKHANSS